MTAPTSAMVPDFFKLNKPNAAFLPTTGEIESLAEGIGQSYAVIGYKGKNWSLRYKGENHLFLRPDDGSPISYIDVVILRQAKVKAKSFYLDGYDENASAGRRPTCSALNGETPDSDAHIKQSESCSICPRNEWRTDPKTGRKGRECQDYKRLAVLLLPSQTQRLLGEALIEPAFLRIPPASLNDLAVFGDTMARQGWPFYAFVTRITFDPTVSHPKFVFQAISVMGADEAKVVMELREDPQSKRVTGEDNGFVAAALPMQNPGLIARAPAAAPAAAPVVAPVVVPATAPVTIMQPTFGFNVPDELSKNTGAAPQTSEDVGDVVESDDLDAKIAALMKV